MGQTKAQQQRKGRPSRAGARSTFIQSYWSFRHPTNMGRRAFKVFKRELGYGHSMVKAEALAKSCASAHGAGAEAHFQRLLRAWHEAHPGWSHPSWGQQPAQEEASA